ncbi:acetamidase/formamidase family protein [Halogeometricum luteum]|uniref:Acetamidase/formamidase family protein n=1 Tax=Halogeometricum luteum TaxID=2950537 RepID=A0ABU2G356_9EURY|nr:acetamidase/formamidase family protein [Halogeometricum sp. S3BR5-2]MDS0294608.1 acetamidase/formamidase family protein [Halogeometricum sp. S3BR5-2]
MKRRTMMKAASALGITGAGAATLGENVDVTAAQETETAEGTETATDGEDEDSEGTYEADYVVESTPENVVWGAIDPTKEPVQRVSSGSTVRIETISHEGILEDQPDPEEFFTNRGIPESEILEDQVRVHDEVPHDGAGPHVVTGPVYVEGAEPGDVLEVEVLDIEFRVPYGANTFRQGKGGLPSEFTWNDSEVIEFDIERGVALLGDDIEIPLTPFQGIMAVGPSPTTGRVNSVPPGPFGGNIDIQGTGTGTTLYFPVFTEGALFFTGDGHALQGNGEVDLTALETSLTSTFRFTLHKDAEQMDWPVAETDEDVLVMGIDEDLDQAMEQALREAISVLVHQKGMTPTEAYRLCSLAADFNVSQIVDINKGIHGKIPKGVFEAGFEVDPTSLGESF